MDFSRNFLKYHLVKLASEDCQYESTSEDVIDIFADVVIDRITTLCRLASSIAQRSGRTQTNCIDIMNALRRFKEDTLSLCIFLGEQQVQEDTVEYPEIPVKVKSGFYDEQTATEDKKPFRVNEEYITDSRIPPFFPSPYGPKGLNTDQPPEQQHDLQTKITYRPIKLMRNEFVDAILYAKHQKSAK